MNTYCVESSVCRQPSLETTCEPPTGLDFFLYFGNRKPADETLQLLAH